MDKMSFISDDFRMSQECVEKGWVMPYTHYHKSHEIYLLESGERIVTVDGEDYKTGAWDAALFGSDIPHRSRGETAFSGICLHFSERYLDMYFSETAKHRLMACFQHRVAHLSQEQFARIKYFADNFNVAAPDNFVRLAEILTMINRALSMDAVQGEPVIEKMEDGENKAGEILTYVNQNYTEIDRIEKITRQCGVSENYVFQVFRERYGMTPKWYINELRIRNACHRLKYTQENIKQVSMRSGFESYSYFARIFKRITGMTPTQYREREKDNRL